MNDHVGEKSEDTTVWNLHKLLPGDFKVPTNCHLDRCRHVYSLGCCPGGFLGILPGADGLSTGVCVERARSDGTYRGIDISSMLRSNGSR